MENDQQKSRFFTSFLGFHCMFIEKRFGDQLFTLKISLQMNEILVKLAVNKTAGFFKTKEEVKIFWKSPFVENTVLLINT